MIDKGFHRYSKKTVACGMANSNHAIGIKIMSWNEKKRDNIDQT